MQRCKKQLNLAQFSNATDAAGKEFLDSAMAIIAISVLGFSTTQIGILDFLESSAFMFLVLPIGMLVDRFNPGKILALSLGLKIILSAALCLGLALGITSPIFFMALVFFLGIAVVASENSQTTLVPFLTGKDQQIENAVSKMAMADSIAGVIAPAAAGFVLAFFSPAFATSIALVCFMFALWAALEILRSLMRAKELSAGSREETLETKAEINDPETDNSETSAETEAPKDTRPFIKKLTEGFSIIAENRFLLGAVILISAGNIGLAMSDSMVSVVILRELNLGMPFFGILGTLGALSGILAASLAPKIVSKVELRKIYIISSIVQTVVASLPLIALLLPQAAYVLFALNSIAWAFNITIANIAGFTYVAKVVDKKRLGRASATLRMITMGPVPFAALLGGILADLGNLILPLVIWPALTAIALVSICY